MQFPPSFLDEIRLRLRPSAVLGKDLRLIAKGKGEFMALCPFHKEKTPSFSISDDKQFYHCFGCGAHGDIIRYRMEHHKQSFPEAVTQLADEAGLSLPKPETVEQKQARERKDILKELMEWAAGWYSQQLQTQAGEAVRHYLERRQLSAEIIRAFRLGFAPEGRVGLKNYLLSKGASIADMVEAGLLIQPEEGEAYDRFRGRLMFPILDVKSAVVAFGGRALKEDQQPKYLNSPETPIFHKGFQLYHYDKARAASKTENRIIVVEGYMDVIAFARAGIHTAVAPLGTALTAEQLQLCWSCQQEPVLCMDGDAAGQRAMLRAANTALPLLTPGHSLQYVFLPKGQDPDDLLNASGALALHDLLRRTEPLAEMLWRHALEQHAPRTPEQRAALEKNMLEKVASIEDKTVRDHYREFILAKLWELKRTKKQPSSGPRSGSPAMAAHVPLPQRAAASKRAQLESAMVMLVIDMPELLLHTEIAESFFTLEFAQSDRLSPLREAISNLLEEKDFYALEPEARAIFCAQFPDLLAAKGFASTLNTLKNQRFLDKQALNGRETVSLAAWAYLAAALQVEHVTVEYEQAVRDWWEQDPEKVAAFHSQKALAEEMALLARRNLEALVE